MDKHMLWLIAGLVLLAVMLIVQYLTRKVENSFVTRLISGVILLDIALIVIIRGSYLLYAVCLVLSLIGAFEFYRAMGLYSRGKKRTPLEIVGYIGVILYYLSLISGGQMPRIISVVLCVTLLMSVYVFTFPAFRIGQVMTALFGIIYVGVMLSFIYQTRMLPNGRYSVWLIFICSWGCDTCAYLFGRMFGRHKMTPVLSPHKTIEGAVGGIVGASVLGLLFALLTREDAAAFMIISAIGAVISIIGDLAASAVKRNEDIKDYGTLIPGHGGVLDRFDGVIFTAPVIYFLAYTVSM
jgi:phosphatidate cytidylyltransferase